MRLLWIGSFASDEMLNKMPVKTIGQASGVTSQRSLISGIDQCIASTGVVLDTLSEQGVPLFPTYPDKCFAEETWSRNGLSKDISIGFDNSNRIRRELSQRKELVKAARRWIATIPKEEKVLVFLYEPVLSRLAAVEEIKRKHQNTICTLIVPDIPEFVVNKKSVPIRILNDMRKHAVNHMLRYVDKYVFYAEKMAEYYHVPTGRYIVIEGSIDLRDSQHLISNQTDSKEFALMYSGAITSGRGIPDFINAFMEYKDPDVRLWLTGGGNCDNLIHECEKKDSRIHHFGFLDTREEVLEKEAQATALLHIRNRQELSSSYCFPSKLFEYLASGKPVVSVRIEGIPDEYYEYMIEMKSLAAADVVEAIDNVKKMSSEERRNFGGRARKFVLEHKSSAVQARKLINFAIGELS